MSLVVEICRASFELRKPDAPARAVQALDRARRLNDAETTAALAGVLDKHRHRRLEVDDLGPTPELLVYQRRRRRGDTIEALVRTRVLSWRQQGAALQIGQVVEAVTSGLCARGASYEQGRVDGSAAAGMPEHIAALYQRRYRPWGHWMRTPNSLHQTCKTCRREYAGVALLSACVGCGSRQLWRARPHLPLVLAVAAFGAGLEECAVAYRMRRPRALRLLRLGLDRYADFAEDD